tara:strand:- start:30730 stop:30987 length:258 start_codon:yes stop_codon:yes gene_type:complete
MKKTKEDFIKEVINKMLEKHNVDYDYVMKNTSMDEVPWYEHFTHTLIEEEQLEKFFHEKYKKYFKTNSKNEWNMFNLMWGLKIKQ